MRLRQGWVPAAGFGVVLLGATAVPRTPWPYGRAPTIEQVHALVDDALRIASRERVDELAATKHPVEEIESASVVQARVDEGAFDPELIFLLGDSFFGHEFGRKGGLGGLHPPNHIQRVHAGVSGGLDTFSCAGCHAVGGLDGAGTFGQSAFVTGDGAHRSSAAVRNAPSLAGGGLVQALAAEMTAELQAQRDGATPGATVRLRSKGVEFGSLRVRDDGTVDTSGVVGVSPDLVVRPFGWKGDVARIRRMVEEAARIHFGAQSTVLEEAYREKPDVARLGPGPDWWDPDHDGVTRELEEGSLSVTALYLAMLEAPVAIPPNDPALLHRWSRGSAKMDELGCTACHSRTLHLDDRYWKEHSDTTDAPPVVVNLLKDGDSPKGEDEVMLFSDLKRHDMGATLADPVDNADGIGRSVFLTRPLWGVADTAPYLHDGRAPTLPAAILAHGGEAQAARDAFTQASPEDKIDLEIFLMSLTRAPRVRVVR